MLKIQTKELIICIIAIVFLAFTSTNVFAMDINELLTDDVSDNEVNNEDLNEIPNGAVDNEEDSELINEEIPEQNEAEENNNTNEAPDELVNTGLEDFNGIIIIALFAVSAVYAYKKVKEYNNI